MATLIFYRRIAGSDVTVMPPLTPELALNEECKSK